MTGFAPGILHSRGDGLPVAMERKLVLRRSAALRECHSDATQRLNDLPVTGLNAQALSG
jgi:hypothetical protein